MYNYTVMSHNYSAFCRARPSPADAVRPLKRAGWPSPPCGIKAPLRLVFHTPPPNGPFSRCHIEILTLYREKQRPSSPKMREAACFHTKRGRPAGVLIFPNQKALQPAFAPDFSLNIKRTQAAKRRGHPRHRACQRPFARGKAAARLARCRRAFCVSPAPARKEPAARCLLARAPNRR